MSPQRLPRAYRVAYLGNFAPEHSTENEMLRALRWHGQDVFTAQENDPNAWLALIRMLDGGGTPDIVLWTRTGWDWPRFGWTAEEARATQEKVLALCLVRGIPAVGFHLDRWWGLDREGQVKEEPFFQVDMLFTADGGHDEEWATAGVNHRWLPPGVGRAEVLRRGVPRDHLRSPVAFVGSWQGYHPEWAWRREMVEACMARYGERFAVHTGGVRGQDLADLYASVDVLVGDSCLVPGSDGLPIIRYHSDRIAETLGRGGFLIHPWVEGATDGTLYEPGVHLGVFDRGLGVEALFGTVDYWLDSPDERLACTVRARAHVLEHHTYETRVEQIHAVLVEEGMLAE